jgi:ketosteroid isomerase-like protein
MKSKALIALAMFSLAACNSSTETKTEAVDSSAVAVTATDADAVKSLVLPQSTSDPVRKSYEAFASGDLNTFAADWDDNVKVYYPGPGDSLVGKKAALDFFTARRSKYESVQIVNPTYLAVQNNEPNSTVAQGDWLMSWHTFVYKVKGNGKTVVLPIHSVQHRNSAGKIDIIAMYYDMHRLMEAAK